MKEQWHKATPVGLEHLHNEYKLTRMYYSHPSFKVNKESPEGFEPLINNLDKYYFSMKLFWSLLIVNNKNYLRTKNENVENELLYEILKLSNTRNFTTIPQINLLQLLLKSFLSSNFDDLESIKDLFVNQLHLYDESERSYIFTQWCPVKIIKGGINLKRFIPIAYFVFAK